MDLELELDMEYGDADGCRGGDYAGPDPDPDPGPSPSVGFPIFVHTLCVWGLWSAALWLHGVFA
jgi:hypothetical protein